MKVDSPGQVSSAIYKALSLKKPYLIEIVVDKNEEIPLPRFQNESFNDKPTVQLI